MNRLRRLVGTRRRRPRACSSQGTLPGGAGAPPGDTTVPCQELADGRAFKACPRRGGHGPSGRVLPRPTARPRRLFRKRGPAPQQTPRRRAERRHALSEKEARARKRLSACWRAVPLAFLRRGNRVPAKAGMKQLGRACAPRERWSLPAMPIILFVIPGRERERANPESSDRLAASGTGFRVRGLRPRPGMTDKMRAGNNGACRA
jgi:hypothetical protein